MAVALRKDDVQELDRRHGYFPEKYGDTLVPLLLSLIDGQKQPRNVSINHRVITGEHPGHLPERLQVAADPGAS